jgi:phage shock protein PspC (stress-responsive transcriptional regulator)
MKEELRRSATDVKICGVCGGIAEYLGVDSNLVRLIWIAVSVFAGTGILLYILAAVLMPKANETQKDLQEAVQPEHNGANA